MRRSVLLILVASLILAFSAAAAQAASVWVPLARGVLPGSEPQVSQAGPGGPDSMSFDISIPGFYCTAASSAGRIFEKIEVPGTSPAGPGPFAGLPVIRRLIAASESSKLSVRVVAADWAEFRLAAAPFLENGEQASETDAIAHNAEPAPGRGGSARAAARIGEYFVIRDVRGAEVIVNAFSYDGRTGKLRVAKKLRIEVSSDSPLPRSINKAVPYEFAGIYERLFDNFTGATGEVIARYELGKILMITHDDFEFETMPLAEWKRDQGHDVRIAKMSDIGTTPEAVQAYIKSEFDSMAPTYIVLIGDTGFVPTLSGYKDRAASDACYAKLAGNDHVPDAFVSRISARTADEVRNQVFKIICYERYPSRDIEARWYKKGCGIACAEPKADGRELAERLRAGYERHGFVTVDRLYDPNASKLQFTRAVNEGRSVINYVGRASRTAWTSTGFSVNDAASLRNGLMLPVVWSSAGLAGAFREDGDCLCEAWMKAGTPEKTAGAVAVFGASTATEWGPSCDLQYEINIVQTLQGRQSTVGAIATASVIRAMQIWGFTQTSPGVTLAEQFNLFGDCSMLVRNAPPGEIEYSISRRADKLTVRVTANGRPLKFARVALSVGQNAESKARVTGDDGLATMQFECLKATGTQQFAGSLTITGQNLVPIVSRTISL